MDFELERVFAGLVGFDVEVGVIADDAIDEQREFRLRGLLKLGDVFFLKQRTALATGRDVQLQAFDVHGADVGFGVKEGAERRCGR